MREKERERGGAREREWFPEIDFFYDHINGAM